MNEIVERFRSRLLAEAARFARGRTVDANHLELAYQRLLASSLADWSVVNRRRVYLLQKENAGDLSPAESRELAALQAEADRHMSEVAPRPLEALWELKRQLTDQ